MLIKRIKTILQFIFFLSLGVFLIWFSTKSFTANEINKVKQLVFNAKPIIIVPCILILVLSHYIRAIRWKMLIKPLGKTPGTSNVFLAVLTGFFFNLLFPRLGEVMKCSLLGKYEKIPVDKLIGTMVAERVLDLICLILVIFLAISTQIDLVGGYAKELFDQILSKINASPTAILFLIILLFSMAAIIYFIYKKARHSALLSKINNWIKGIVEGLISVRKIENKTMFIVYTLSIWFLYLSSIRVGFYAMEDLVQLGWVPSLTILTFGSFAMIATQGGIGAYQFAVQKTLLLYGVKEVSGLAFGWLLWAVQTVMLFITGPISLVLLFMLNKKSIKQNLNH
ncbi:MAG: lysylphosphatidylglycerol synthase transmembrane domain-containing protein [bacterium]